MRELHLRFGDAWRDLLQDQLYSGCAVRDIGSSAFEAGVPMPVEVGSTSSFVLKNTGFLGNQVT